MVWQTFIHSNPSTFNFCIFTSINHSINKQFLRYSWVLNNYSSIFSISFNKYSNIEFGFFSKIIFNILVILIASFKAHIIAIKRLTICFQRKNKQQNENN